MDHAARDRRARAARDRPPRRGEAHHAASRSRTRWRCPSCPGRRQVGSVAPALQKVETFRGNAELAAGTPRLLFFWATWCVPCKFALPEVMAFAAARNVAGAGDHRRGARDAAGILQAVQGAVPGDRRASTPTAAAFQTYGVSGTPTFVYIDGSGVVRYYKTGYDAAKGLEIEGWDYKAAKKQG